MAKQITPLQPQTYLTQKMATVLQALNYDTASINTLITRAESNTIEVADIPAHNFLGDIESITSYLDTLLDPVTLRERNIYLNSNEPVLLLGYPQALELAADQVRAVKDGVIAVLRDRGVKPVRVYLGETEDDGLGFTLLNVVNSDIGVNMVGLLDEAFGGDGWTGELVLVEAYNGYDLIRRDEVWKEEKKQEVKVVEHDVVKEAEEVSAEPVADTVAAESASATVSPPTTAIAPPHLTEAGAIEQDPVETGTAGAELQRMPDAPVRSFSYKSADDIPESSDDEEPEAVQHPALRELLEREAQRPPVQYPTWSRDHDGEAYLDIIKTHSRGGQQEEEGSMSVVTRPEGEKEDFEVVEKP